MLRGPSLALVLAWGLAAPGIGQAGEAPPGVRPDLLLRDPGTDAPSARRRAVGTTHDPVPAADALAQPVPARLFGMVTAEGCAAEPMGTAQLGAALDEADEALFQLEFERAEEILAHVGTRVNCASDLLSTDVLSRLFFLLGLSASYAADSERAVRFFAQSIVVQPDQDFDSDFPPRVYQQYLQAMEQHYRSTPVPVVVLRGEGESVEVSIDGLQIDPDAPPKLGSGYHFLQLQGAEGQLSTWQFLCAEDSQIVLATSSGLLRAVLTGPSGPLVYQPAVAAVLGELADREAAPGVQVVNGRSLHRFDAASGRYEVLRAPLDPVVRNRRFGKGMVIGGGAILALGGGLALATYIQGTETLHPAQGAYFDARNANIAGGIAAGVGGLIVAAGLPILLSSGPTRKPAARLVVAVDPASGGLRVGLRGALP